MTYHKILFYLLAILILGCESEPGPTDKMKIFGRRTLIAAGPKICIHQDPLMPFEHDIGLIMYQDTANLNTAFRLAGSVTPLYIGGEKSFQDSALITGYQVKLFPGDSCKGEFLCSKDTTFTFHAFKKSEQNDLGNFEMGMAKHDNGVLGKLIRSCPCESSVEEPLSLSIHVNYLIHRKIIYDNGNLQENLIAGNCQSAFRAA